MLGPLWRKSGQSRLFPDLDTARLPAKPRRALREAEGSWSSCATLFLSVDLGISNVPGLAIGPEKQLEYGSQLSGKNPLSANIPSLAGAGAAAGN